MALKGELLVGRGLKDEYLCYAQWWERLLYGSEPRDYCVQYDYLSPLCNWITSFPSHHLSNISLHPLHLSFRILFVLLSPISTWSVRLSVMRARGQCQQHGERKPHNTHDFSWCSKTVSNLKAPPNPTLLQFAFWEQHGKLCSKQHDTFVEVDNKDNKKSRVIWNLIHFQNRPSPPPAMTMMPTYLAEKRGYKYSSNIKSLSKQIQENTNLIT